MATFLLVPGFAAAAWLLTGAAAGFGLWKAGVMATDPFDVFDLDEPDPLVLHVVRCAPSREPGRHAAPVSCCRVPGYLPAPKKVKRTLEVVA
jgi:hypothetical protein